MKYSASTRLINIVIFAILLVGAAFLGVWFSFVVTPNLIPELPLPSWTGAELPNISVGLSAMLGTLGLALTLAALVGLVNSVRAFLKGNNDELVQKSFGAYIAMGYIVAAWLLLSALWLYRLTSTNLGDDDLGFIITVYVVAFILVLIVSNVPLLKLFGEGEHSNQIMQIITSALICAELGAAMTFGPTYFVALAHASTIAHYSAVSAKLLTYFLAPLAAAILGVLAYIGYGKAHRHGEEVRKGNGYLFEASIAIIGLAIVAAGVFEYIFAENKIENISFMAKVFRAENVHYIEFLVMSCITGGLLTIGSGVLAYFTTFPPKLKIEDR